MNTCEHFTNLEEHSYLEEGSSEDSYVEDDDLYENFRGGRRRHRRHHRHRRRPYYAQYNQPLWYQPQVLYPGCTPYSCPYQYPIYHPQFCMTRTPYGIGGCVPNSSDRCLCSGDPNINGGREWNCTHPSFGGQGVPWWSTCARR